MTEYGGMPINAAIDSTLLNHDASDIDIDELCSGAQWFRLYGVCVFPEHVALAREFITGRIVTIVTVVNFPAGDLPIESVLEQIDTVISDGAEEIDYVMNLPAALANDWDKVSEDIAQVVARVHEQDCLVKIILETCLLSNEQIIRACEIALEHQADFVKTSTGFSKAGATVEVVRLMRSVVGEKMGVKASGGIRDRETAIAMLNAGANRLGTSSAMKIIGVDKSDL
jgi:deoxyribose-phosphate aldolase